MGEYKVCNNCHLAFDKNLENCPSCGKIIEDETLKKVIETEGSGRRHGAGGEACDYCPHCYGTENWCPILGD